MSTVGSTTTTTKMLWIQQLPSYRKSGLERRCGPTNLTYIFQHFCTCRFNRMQSSQLPWFSAWKEATARFISRKKLSFSIAWVKKLLIAPSSKIQLTCRFCNENPQLYISQMNFYVPKNKFQKFFQRVLIDWAESAPWNL